MSKRIFLIILSVLLCISFLFSAQRVASPWDQVQKYIAVHPGTAESVWENRAAVTNGLMEMTPVGDGTFEAVIPLVPGAAYNYLLFAKTDDNPPAGLQPNTDYFDCVPTSGFIQNSRDANSVITYDSVNISPVRYVEIEWFNPSENRYDRDARRLIEVPSDLNPGDRFYVFNNFADKPVTVDFFSATAVGETTVVLSWGAPYGAWGTGGESVKAADVIAGGEYVLFRNVVGDTSSFQQIAILSGTTFNYRDAGLTQGTEYFYTILIRDAYTGTANQPFAQLSSDTFSPVSATPNPPIDVYLKIEGMDYDYIRSRNYNVFLTDSTAENKYFAPRSQGKLVRIEL